MDKSIIAKKTANATKWSSITELLARCITPIVNIILARLLAPEIFGVVATISVVVSFAEIFTDAGFQKYIMQHDFKNEEELDKSTNVAFITNLVLSLFFWGAICIFNNQLASLLGVEGKGLAIIIASAAIPIVAFSSIQMSRFKRDFNFKSLFFIRIITCFVPIIITIPLAIIFRTYWALIIGTLASNLVNAVFLTIKSKWKPNFFFSFKILKQMFSYSWWILLESIAVWLTSYIGTFIVGQYLSLHYVGLYNTSMNTVNQIISLITAATSAPLFVALSQFQHDNEQLLNTYYDFIKAISVVMIPIGFGIFMFKDTVTMLLLGEQWKEASNLIGMWGLSSSISLVLGTYCNGVYNAKGKTYLSFFSQILHLIVLIPAIIWGAKKGFETLAIIRSVVRVELIIVQMLFMKFFIKASWKKLFLAVFPALVCSVAMSGVAWGLSCVSVDLPWQIISILICIIVYFAVLYVLNKGALFNCLKIFGVIKADKKPLEKAESSQETTSPPPCQNEDGILEKCNFIKVIMMLIVILCHCVSLWARGGWFNQPPAQSSGILAFISEWFGTFHIYTFIFISGYLFYYLKLERNKYKTFGNLIKNKSKRLLVPYVITAVIWVIPFQILFFNSSVNDILQKYLLAIAPSQLWFVVMLFVVFILFYPLTNFFEKSNIFIGGAFCLILYLIGIIGPSYVPNVFNIWSALKYFIFFYFGFIIRKYKNNFVCKIPWFIYLILQIGLFSIYYYIVSVRAGTIYKILSLAIHPICSVLGVLMIITFVKAINTKKLETTKIYKLLLNHNFTMYLFHQQIIYITISLLNGYVNSYLLVAINLTVSILGSLIISVLISKIPKIRNLFGYKQ